MKGFYDESNNFNLISPKLKALSNFVKLEVLSSIFFFYLVNAGE